MIGVQSEENHDPQSVIVGQPQSLQSSVRTFRGHGTYQKRYDVQRALTQSPIKLSSYIWGAGLRMGVRQNNTILLHLSFPWGWVGDGILCISKLLLLPAVLYFIGDQGESRARSLSLRMGNRTGQYSLFLT